MSNIIIGICFILFGILFLVDLNQSRYSEDDRQFVKFCIGFGSIVVGILSCFNLI